MDNKNVLAEIKHQIYEEREEVQNLLNINLSKIEEIEKYLKSILDEENSDYRVFSPRSAEKIHKEEIDKNNTEKQKLELENQVFYKRLNQLDKYLNGLKSVIESDSDDTHKNIKVLDIQEKERQRIARDLHDTSLQNLAYLVHKIELSSMYIDKDPERAKLELVSVNKNLRETIEEIRNTIFDLRPMSFDDLGLKESLERLISKLKQANPKIDFVFDLNELNYTNDLAAMEIFRVIRECCSNAVKYSNGNKIFVSVKNEDDECIIEIRDNGHGFDVQEVLNKKDNHFGLMIIKERIDILGGNIKIQSSIEEGTLVRAVIPLSAL